MSKRSLVLLIIFILSLASFLAVNFMDPNALPVSFQEQVSPQEIISESKLYFSPDFVDSALGGSTSVNVVLETLKKPTVVQLEIAYDPSVLYYVSVLPGNFFQNPEVVLNNIDLNTGRISYAVKCTSDPLANLNCVNPIPNSNIVATISFTPVNFGLTREASLKFLPKTAVRENSEVIELNSSSEAKIMLPPPIFIPSATPSATVPM